MELDETMVEQEDNAAVDEVLPDDIVEEPEETPEESLESIVGDEGQPAEKEPEKTQGTSEPGWFQRRWDKNVEKLSSQIREEVRSEYEAQIAPLRDRLLDMDARELVKKGDFRTVELAKEYLQLKQGIAPSAPAPAKPAEQPRQSNGQFAPKSDPGVTAQINMLAHQADTIKAKTGVDVMAEFSSNPEIKQKVMAGEMDFYDVLDQMKAPRKKPPAPMRSPNGVNGQIKSTIMSMTDKQFEQLEKRVREGARFRE